MKTNRLFWTLGWVTMGSLAALQGCGGDDDEGAATGGSAGEDSGGTAGTGTGGTAGKATGGTAGKATGGTAGTTTGGTAGTAGTAPEGGMGGDGVGGEGGGGSVDRLALCTEYCQAYSDKACFDAALDTYDDEPTCRDTCVSSDWEIGADGAASGDSINCRLTHTGLASAPSPGPDMLHCGHASETPPMNSPCT